jgi:hypothetical protein
MDSVSKTIVAPNIPKTMDNIQRNVCIFISKYVAANTNASFSVKVLTAQFESGLATLTLRQHDYGF